MRRMAISEYFRQKKYFVHKEIRKKSGFTVKQSQTNEFDSVEYETEIQDADAMKNALLFRGYREAAIVEKKRCTARYDNWEICLDDVSALGAFIEVEKIADGMGGNSETIQDTLFDFSLSLGTLSEDRIMQSCGILLYLNGKSN